MKLIDLPTGPFGPDTRARNVTRPAMTTVLFLTLAVMIVLDILRRRRSAAA
ncbi:MAG: hypothetical protein JWR73_2025 [Tardiphaga sp.]|jgi:hypothetical protein|nr:hypothetical protein [Tardiphaga sp.]